MPDNTNASVGWGGQLGIASATGVLTKIAGVRRLKPPSNQRQRVDATHLESPDMREQTIPGMRQASTITATVIYEAGSATDTLLKEAESSGTSRDVKIGIPFRGEVVEHDSFTGIVTGYERDDIEANGLMTATLTISVESAVTTVDGPVTFA